MKFVKISVIGFEQWLANNPDIAAEAKMDDCPECNGLGEKECSECGHMTECDTCEGKGKVNSALALYEESVSRDYHQLKAHTVDGRIYALPVAQVQP